MQVDRPPEKVGRVRRQNRQVFAQVLAALGARQNVRHRLVESEVRLGFIGRDVRPGAQGRHMDHGPKVGAKNSRTDSH